MNSKEFELLRERIDADYRRLKSLEERLNKLLEEERESREIGWWLVAYLGYECPFWWDGNEWCYLSSSGDLQKIDPAFITKIKGKLVLVDKDRVNW